MISNLNDLYRVDLFSSSHAMGLNCSLLVLPVPLGD